MAPRGEHAVALPLQQGNNVDQDGGREWRGAPDAWRRGIGNPSDPKTVPVLFLGQLETKKQLPRSRRKPYAVRIPCAVLRTRPLYTQAVPNPTGL